MREQQSRRGLGGCASKGGSTASRPNRLNQRHRAFIAANEVIINGKRVLDIASHDGRWSFAALAVGARHIYGIEAREHLVSNAEGNFRAYPEARAEIERIAKMAPGVVGTNQVLTMHFGPYEVLAALSLDFDDRRSAGDVEAAVSLIEREIKAAFPEVTRVFVEAKDRNAPEPDGNAGVV